MAWIVKDKDKDICYLLKEKPIKKHFNWEFPKNTELKDFRPLHLEEVESIFGIKPKWEDDPIEVIVKKN